MGETEREKEAVMIALERHQRQDDGEEELYMSYLEVVSVGLDSYDDS